MTPLTPRQLEYVDFIKGYIGKHRCAPTCREIAENFGICESSGHKMVIQLEKRQALVRVHDGYRAIKLLGEFA